MRYPVLNKAGDGDVEEIEMMRETEMVRETKMARERKMAREIAREMRGDGDI